MRKKFETEIKVGLFVAIGVGLIMLAILLLGGAESLLTRQNHYTVHFPAVEGLVNGAKVVLDGLRIGVVDEVDFDPKTKDIMVGITVPRKYSEWIRKDSSAEILTQGVLGDKYISISPGTQEEPKIENHTEIPPRPTKDLAQFLTKGDQLMVSLNKIAGSMDRLLKTLETGNRGEMIFQGLAQTAKNMAQVSAKLDKEMDNLNLKKVTKNLNSILEKVDNGTGTLGALVNDPGLYDDAKALMGGANRNRIVRNLVRKTIKEGEEKEQKK